jgi:hypothetical protein
MNKITLTGAAGAAVLALAALLVGCATPGGLPPGTTIDAVRHGMRSPTDEYALPGGGTRLAFTQGSFNRETWMLDFDANGALVSSQQVLTERNFANITPGMSADEVRLRLGRPVQVFGAGWQEHIQVWNYRFAGGDCVWFQVSIRDADHKVREASLGQDPACDGGRDPRD